MQIFKFLLFSIFFCALYGSFAGSLSGQQVELSFRNALDTALQGNPQLAAAEGCIGEARGQQIQAGLKPNPRLTLQSEDIRQSTRQTPFSFVDSTEDYVLVGQVIENGGKLLTHYQKPEDILGGERAVEAADQSPGGTRCGSRIDASSGIGKA